MRELPVFHLKPVHVARVLERKSTNSGNGHKHFQMLLVKRSCRVCRGEVETPVGTFITVKGTQRTDRSPAFLKLSLTSPEARRSFRSTARPDLIVS